MTALMTLESDHYYQERQNVDAYADKFRELIAISGYMDLIAVVLKFCRGLNPTTQDKITKSGTDRPNDNDLKGWLQAARRFDLNRLANEAFRYTSRRPTTTTTTTQPAQPTFSYLRPNALTPATLAAMPTVSCAPPPTTSKILSDSCFRCKQSGHIS
jgi:hypothetical protein